MFDAHLVSFPKLYLLLCTSSHLNMSSATTSLFHLDRALQDGSARLESQPLGGGSRRIRNSSLALSTTKTRATLGYLRPFLKTKQAKSCAPPNQHDNSVSLDPKHNYNYWSLRTKSKIFPVLIYVLFPWYKLLFKVELSWFLLPSDVAVLKWSKLRVKLQLNHWLYSSTYRNETRVHGELTPSGIFCNHFFLKLKQLSLPSDMHRCSFHISSSFLHLLLWVFSCMRTVGHDSITCAFKSTETQRKASAKTPHRFFHTIISLSKTSVVSWWFQMMGQWRFRKSCHGH